MPTSHLRFWTLGHGFVLVTRCCSRLTQAAPGHSLGHVGQRSGQPPLWFQVKVYHHVGLAAQRGVTNFLPTRGRLSSFPPISVLPIIAQCSLTD